MPNKSVTKMFLHKTFETNPSFQQKKKVLSMAQVDGSFNSPSSYEFSFEN